jgi:hypothetical protein
MSLTEDLTKLREAARSKIPADQYEIIVRATESLAQSGIVDSALKEGEPAPDFLLPNALGTDISLSELLRKGPVVLSFYRGGW